MRVHLISFDIPYPANYGGVQLVFNRLRALHEAGAAVTLHCFQYGDRTPQVQLEAYCAAVYYYRRSRAWWLQLSDEPFIIRTRRHPDLLRRLQLDDAPILFEGLHTTAYIDHPSLAARTKIVLLHNVEWQYYAGLARLTDDFLPKTYFQLESRRLRRAEVRVAKQASALVALSVADAAYYRRLHPFTLYVPVFHGHTEFEIETGLGKYVLFQGKLSVTDNARAAAWLMADVMAQLPDIAFVVAGLDPPDWLRQLAGHYPNVRLVANPDQEAMETLLREAQVHLLVSFLAAGVKLKLLHALFRGRHCLVNAPMVDGGDLGPACTVRNEAAELIESVRALMTQPFGEAQIAERKKRLLPAYSDLENARRLIELIGGRREHPNQLPDKPDEPV